VSNIQPGEEITDDYGLFNLPYNMPCACDHLNCRGSVRPSDFVRLIPQWDARLNTALDKLNAVEQPLWRLMGEETKTTVIADLATGNFRSVQALSVKSGMASR
jgi:hypothetical protein